MIAVLVNTIAVIVGALLGVLFKKGFPERVSKAVMVTMGLCVVYIGIDEVFEVDNVIVMISSLALGTMVGALLKIESNLNKFTSFVEKKLTKNLEKATLSQGFVSASLLFCVGAMAITGSIKAGLQNDYTIIFAKSIIDAVCAFTLASALGVGVALSSISVLLYQGALTLLAGLLKDVPIELINNITGVGGIMVLAIGLNLIGITKIRIADMLPAILFAIPLHFLFGLIGV